jgi:RNA recognition motif-containing protein
LEGIPRAFKEGSGVFFGTKSTARQIRCPAKARASVPAHAVSLIPYEDGKGFSDTVRKLTRQKTLNRNSIRSKKMNIYVGNLSFDTTEQDLRQAFEAFGQVTSTNIISDKITGQSKGFGFIEMSEKDQAQAAIDGMNGKEIKGRAMNVNEARPRNNDRTGSRGMSRPQGRSRF